MTIDRNTVLRLISAVLKALSAFILPIMFCLPCASISSVWLVSNPLRRIDNGVVLLDYVSETLGKPLTGLLLFLLAFGAAKVIDRVIEVDDNVYQIGVMVKKLLPPTPPK